MSGAAGRLKILQGHLQEPSPTSYLDSPKKYRFTLDNSTLNEEQRTFYEQNGFIVIRKLLPEHLLDKWSKYFRDLCDGKVNRGRITMMRDVSLAKNGINGTGEKLYNKIQDFMWDDVLYEYLSYPGVLDVAECMTGPNITVMHTMLINKPPDTGSQSSRHPLHQDLHYFPFRPADRIVCSWTAMEKVTRENGCLVVLPGTHRGTLHPHEYPQWEGGVNFAYHGVIGFDGHERIHLEMEKGDTVFFHPILIHGSGANKTQGYRKAISGHYAASECNYIPVEGTSQESIAKEVENIAAKRGLPTDFKEIWHYRSRLVRGKEINL